MNTATDDEEIFEQGEKGEEKTPDKPEFWSSREIRSIRMEELKNNYFG